MDVDVCVIVCRCVCDIVMFDRAIQYVCVLQEVFLLLRRGRVVDCSMLVFVLCSDDEPIP